MITNKNAIEIRKIKNEYVLCRKDFPKINEIIRFDFGSMRVTTDNGNYSSIRRDQLNGYIAIPKIFLVSKKLGALKIALENFYKIFP